MTPARFRHISRSTGALAVAVLLLAPLSTSATTAPTTTPNPADFCTKLPMIASVVSQALTIRTTGLQADRQTAAAKLAAGRVQIDQGTAAARAEWDNQKQQQFSLLAAKATTSAQHQAVTAYIVAVGNAVSARRAAADQAKATYRSGVDAVEAGRASEIYADVASFLASVQTAENAAQASCDSGAPSAATKADFVTAMAAARTSYADQINAAPSLAPQVSALEATRASTVATVDGTYQNAIHAAAVSLSSALAQN